MTDFNEEQKGQLDQAAITINEMFEAYRRAGFRRKEALELVKAQVTAIQSGNQS